MLVLPAAGATPRQTTQAVNQLIEGRGNATYQITLTTGTETIITDRRIVEGGAPFFTPATASAAAELAAGTMYVGTIEPGRYIITHAAGPADRTFWQVYLGG